MRSPSPIIQPEKKGFTLFELIVSLAITSVIAVFVFGFATSLAKVWRTTERGVSTELDVQITLDQIAADLESAVMQERFDSEGNRVPMFAVSAISKTAGVGIVDYTFSTRWVGISKTLRPATTHFDPANVHYGWAGSWLRFFSSAPSFNAVGYQIIRRSAFSNSNEPKYILHRSVINHANTIEGGVDIVNGVYAYGNIDYGLSMPSLDAVLLEDVIDFGVRLYVFDPTFAGSVDSPDSLRLIFPANANSLVDATDVEHTATRFDGTNYQVRYPDVVEVFLRVLDDAGAAALYDLEELGIGTLTYDEIVARHSKVYRRMIRLPGKELR